MKTSYKVIKAGKVVSYINAKALTEQVLIDLLSLGYTVKASFNGVHNTTKPV